MVRMVCVSFVLPVFSAVAYIVVQANVAPSAFRTFTIIPQYMTKFAMDQVCDNLGLMIQKRFGNCGAISLLYSLLCETGVHHEA